MSNPIQIPDAAKTCVLCGARALFVVHGNIYHAQGGGLYGNARWLAKNYVQPADVPMEGYCKPCLVRHVSGVDFH